MPHRDSRVVGYASIAIATSVARARARPISLGHKSMITFGLKLPKHHYYTSGRGAKTKPTTGDCGRAAAPLSGFASPYTKLLRTVPVRVQRTLAHSALDEHSAR